MTGKPVAGMARLVREARDPRASLQDRHAAFTQLVQRSQHIVFALALTGLRDVEEARDVAQDAFATAWRRLHQLREPSAFAPWLRMIVATECSRRRRRRPLDPESAASPARVEPDARGLDYQSVLAPALGRLPAGERNVIVLYYFLGYTQPEIARLLRLKPGTVGKRLHSARLRIRRALPQSVRRDFVRVEPSKEFAGRVSRGLLDEYVGDYRFDRRPDHVVTITRHGDSLIGESRGQRHLLVAAGEQSLRTKHYDGEGRFRRNRRGEVTHFVYYEFGRRLGVARRIAVSGRES
jgi:RNA polymerase sigma-70 factor (ECF subfamily)